MDLNTLKSFARDSRKELLKSVALKIEYVLSENSAERRENHKAIIELENKIKTSSKDQVIEEVAYTWFNRFTALQYMDINGFNDVRVILPLEGMTRPEILSNAISGLFNNEYISEKTQNIVSSLLDGRIISNYPERESYKLLLISVCNRLHAKMPFLFERILDYTELLIPDDLLSNSSILIKMRDVMTKENYQDVEVIGWLYQYYISDKKDEVFSSLKKKKKIMPQDIPAATQLFTPHWIVKYLVENSLGRLWMLNNPNSSLVNEMEYYIHPEEYERDFLRIKSPEEIKICDPACGSGHLLSYAFDILYSIYESEGYNSSTIPSLILKNNLFAIEIDKRAGQLAAFSLIMKAIKKDKYFFSKSIEPNVCVLENIKFNNQELDEYMNAAGRDLFNDSFLVALKQFEKSDNFGSLIQPLLHDLKDIKEKFESMNFLNNLFLSNMHNKVLKMLNQIDYLQQKYQVVIANPPYLGLKNMNIDLSDYLQKNFKDVKTDLFAAFIYRITKLVVKKGQMGFMTPFVWMFISSYEQLRLFLINKKTITSLVQLEYSGFSGATVPICTFTLQNSFSESFKGAYIKLSSFRGSSNQAPKTLQAIKNNNCGWFYRSSAIEFLKIPGSPISYFISNSIRNTFKKSKCLEDYAHPRQGLGTTNNARFVRCWMEISFNKISFQSKDKKDALFSSKKWFPYSKGGGYRKWYGNEIDVINWEKDGYEIRQNLIGKNPNIPRSESHYFKPGITWGLITSANFSARLSPEGGIFDVGGSKAFPQKSEIEIFLGFLNTNLAAYLLKVINPTLNSQVGDIKKLPIKDFSITQSNVIPKVKRLISISKSDWDSYETSWNFRGTPLLMQNFNTKSLHLAFKKLRSNWNLITDEMLSLEEENNLIFINNYGVDDELKPDVPINQITLNCNPVYRYGDKNNKDLLEKRLQSETIKEFISYSVGCMFGRYSIDQEGLILANQGETLKDYLEKVSNPRFIPDDDNIIPILDLDWFEDDITSRFKNFLKVTFGDINFEENIRFVESSLEKNIRKYFLNDFYNDHVQTYKKRPVYWMFSSPKGSFNALIYLHRYQKDTVSILLEKYLREFLLKLRAEKNTLERLEISSSTSSAEKTRAMKKIQKIDSILNELQNWQKEVIFPLASQRLEIDLDDGVKINYAKFGTALKKISGLN